MILFFFLSVDAVKLISNSVSMFCVPAMIVEGGLELGGAILRMKGMLVHLQRYLGSSVFPFHYRHGK